MADKDIQMTQRNAANTAWDNINPITKAANVKTAGGSDVETQLADISTKQGAIATLQTTDKTSLVKAVNELFQSANNSLTQVSNGKSIIANVVGGINVNNTHTEITNRITAINDTLNNILQSTDRSTLTRTIDWLYQRTTDLAWQLNAKGIAGVSTDGLSILIQRIANINIGKKLASGTAFGIAGSKLKVTGLTFKPTYVLTFSSTYGWGMNVVGREYNTSYHYNGGVFDDNGFHNGGVVGNIVSGGFYITNTEFVVPMAPNSQGIAFDWIAIE